MHEFDWIARYFAPLTNGREEALGLKDDAALLTVPPGMQLVVTTDTSNAGIHFLDSATPQQIAHKSLAVNLSDLAAMGAEPLAYQLALSLPEDTDEPWLAAFCEGLHLLQRECNIFLLGGDTTRTNGQLSVTITAFGLTPQGQALTRAGAKPGDLLYVTGAIGNGYMGLLSAQQKWCNTEVERHYFSPTPRLVIGETLRGIATACVDISDGLLQDAGHIASASGVSINIHANAIPLSGAASTLMAQHNIALTKLLAGGDDYELAFTAPEAHDAKLQHIAAQTGILIHAIGEVRDGSGVMLLDAQGEPITIARAGYQHF